MLVTQDFTSLDALEIIFAPRATGASMHFDIRTYYGAYNGGENHNVHAEVDAGRDIGATVQNQNLAHGIADLVDVTALAAGDFLQVYMAYSAVAIASTSYVKGIRCKYS